MAVLSTATASGKVFYANNVSSTQTTLYTAPSNNSNVTSPSATAYIKEISICNLNASNVTVNIQVNGIYMLNAVSVSANDSKVLSGLNTMINAGATIQASASANTALIISGVEVQ